MWRIRCEMPKSIRTRRADGASRFRIRCSLSASLGPRAARGDRFTGSTKVYCCVRSGDCRSPRHVGIILDGNRRYGEQYGLQNPYEIYLFGALKLEDVLDWCIEVLFRPLRFGLLHRQSHRPANQVSGILAAIETKLRVLARDPLIQQRRVRVQAIGRIEILPGSVVTAIRAACEATAAHNGLVLTIIRPSPMAVAMRSWTRCVGCLPIKPSAALVSST